MQKVEVLYIIGLLQKRMVQALRMQLVSDLSCIKLQINRRLRLVEFALSSHSK